MTFCLLISCVFLIPAAFFGQWRLFWVFLTFFGLFGAQEWIAKAQTGKTICQHFWALDLVNPVGAWIILGCLAVGWGIFLGHLKFH
jgi:hypothetical protein